MRKSGMRKRRVGNYLKAYPHVYEAFQRAISVQNIGLVFLIIVLVIFAFSTLFFWLIGANNMCSLYGAILFVLTFAGIFLLTSKTGVIGLEELELMEKDLAGEKELVKNWGYSTEESFLIGFCRIPRKGLDSVYIGYRVSGGRGCSVGLVNMYCYELEFYYDDGTHISAELSKVSEAPDEKDFIQIIHRYDDSVKIYRHKKMKENAPLFCPFKKLIAEEPSVREEAIENLNTLCIGNPFWRLRAKSRDKWDGNKEVEVTLYGTTLTWLVYIVWLCLSVCFFFYFGVQSEIAAMLVILASGLFYYLFFVKSAGNVTDKALDIFYRDFAEIQMSRS